MSATDTAGAGVAEQIQGKAGAAPQQEKKPNHTAARLREAVYDLFVYRRSMPKIDTALQAFAWKDDQGAMVGYAADHEKWTAEICTRIEELKAFPNNVNIQIDGQDCNAEKALDAIVRGGREMLRKSIAAATKGRKVRD